MKRKQVHDFTHLNLKNQKISQASIENNASKDSIARTIGKSYCWPNDVEMIHQKTMVREMQYR